MKQHGAFFGICGGLYIIWSRWQARSRGGKQRKPKWQRAAGSIHKDETTTLDWLGLLKGTHAVQRGLRPAVSADLLVALAGGGVPGILVLDGHLRQQIRHRPPAGESRRHDQLHLAHLGPESGLLVVAVGGDADDVVGRTAGCESPLPAERVVSAFRRGISVTSIFGNTISSCCCPCCRC